MGKIEEPKIQIPIKIEPVKPEPEVVAEVTSEPKSIEIRRVESLKKIEDIVENRKMDSFDSDSDDDFFNNREDGIDINFLFGARTNKKGFKKVTLEETITVKSGIMDVEPESEDDQNK